MSDHLEPGLPAHPAEVDPQTLPYWDGAQAGALILPWCEACDAPFWYPRGFCPRCGTDRLGWRPASGRGVVHTCTVVRRAAGEWARHVPFAVAIVTLDEGPAVTANVVGCRIQDVAPGLRVVAVFERSDPDGLPVLRFAPRGTGEDRDPTARGRT